MAISESSNNANQPAVLGENTENGGLGVHGICKNGHGVRGESTSSKGVVGTSVTFQGVYGHSKENAGVVGESDNMHGVFGICHNPHGAGVFGTNDKVGGFGVQGINESGDGVIGTGRRGIVGESKTFQGVYGHSKENAGVVGESDKMHAVFGITHSGFAGVYGASDAAGTGVAGESNNGIGVHGKGGRLAGLFEGNVQVTGDINIQGHSIIQIQQRINELEKLVHELVERLNWSQPRGGLSNAPHLDPPFYRGFESGKHIIQLRAWSLEKNRSVTIRVKDRGSFKYETICNSGPQGGFYDLDNRCVLQVPYSGSLNDLFIAITDGRPNSFDLTGLLWSNTVQL